MKTTNRNRIQMIGSIVVVAMMLTICFSAIDVGSDADAPALTTYKYYIYDQTNTAAWEDQWLPAVDALDSVTGFQIAMKAGNVPSTISSTGWITEVGGATSIGSYASGEAYSSFAQYGWNTTSNQWDSNLYIGAAGNTATAFAIGLVNYAANGVTPLTTTGLPADISGAPAPTSSILSTANKTVTTGDTVEVSFTVNTDIPSVSAGVMDIYYDPTVLSISATRTADDFKGTAVTSFSNDAINWNVSGTGLICDSWSIGDPASTLVNGKTYTVVFTSVADLTATKNTVVTGFFYDLCTNDGDIDGYDYMSTKSVPCIVTVNPAVPLGYNTFDDTVRYSGDQVSVTGTLQGESYNYSAEIGYESDKYHFDYAVVTGANAEEYQANDLTVLQGNDLISLSSFYGLEYTAYFTVKDCAAVASASDGVGTIGMNGEELGAYKISTRSQIAVAETVGSDNSAVISLANLPDIAGLELNFNVTAVTGMDVTYEIISDEDNIAVNNNRGMNGIDVLWSNGTNVDMNGALIKINNITALELTSYDVVKTTDNGTAQVYLTTIDEDAAVVPEDPVVTHFRGDSNCDGQRTVVDLVMIAQYLATEDESIFSTVGYENADCGSGALYSYIYTNWSGTVTENFGNGSIGAEDGMWLSFKLAQGA